MSFESTARHHGWKLMSQDIGDLLGLDVTRCTRFHHNSNKGDLSFSTDLTGEEAWKQLCEIAGLR